MSLGNIAFVVTLVLAITATGMSLYTLKRLILLEYKFDHKAIMACTNNKKRRIEEEVQTESEEEEEPQIPVESITADELS